MNIPPGQNGFSTSTSSSMQDVPLTPRTVMMTNTNSVRQSQTTKNVSGANLDEQNPMKPFRPELVRLRVA